MNGARLVFCCIIGYLLILTPEALPWTDIGITDESKRNESDLVIDEVSPRSGYWFEPIDGLKINYDDEDVIFKYQPRSEKDKTVKKKEGAKGVEKKEGVKGVEKKDGDKEKRLHIMKRLGTFMMMIPVGLQLLKLPMAIATVKMDLLRNILVAKVALLVLLLRFLFKPMPEQKVIIVRPPKEQHEHFYHPYGDPEDEKPGWLGKPPSWLQ